MKENKLCPKPFNYTNNPTPKQTFWRHRNYLKFRISSWGLPINDRCLTLFEQDKVRQINELSQALKENWDKNNRLIKRTKADERAIQH